MSSDQERDAPWQHPDTEFARERIRILPSGMATFPATLNISSEPLTYVAHPDDKFRLSGKVTKFKLGDKVRKTKGSRWQGTVVGTYSTCYTLEGYCVESDTEPGSVQIYPASALELLPADWYQQRGSGVLK